MGPVRLSEDDLTPIGDRRGSIPTQWHKPQRDIEKRGIYFIFPGSVNVKAHPGRLLWQETAVNR